MGSLKFSWYEVYQTLRLSNLFAAVLAAAVGWMATDLLPVLHDMGGVAAVIAAFLVRPLAEWLANNQRGH